MSHLLLIIAIVIAIAVAVLASGILIPPYYKPPPQPPQSKMSWNPEREQVVIKYIRQYYPTISDRYAYCIQQEIVKNISFGEFSMTPWIIIPIIKQNKTCIQ